MQIDEHHDESKQNIYFYSFVCLSCNSSIVRVVTDRGKSRLQWSFGPTKRNGMVVRDVSIHSGSQRRQESRGILGTTQRPRLIAGISRIYRCFESRAI